MFPFFFINKFHCNIFCWDYLLFPSTSIAFISRALNPLLYFFSFLSLLFYCQSTFLKLKKRKKKFNNFNEDIIIYCSTTYQSKQIGYTTFSLFGIPAISLIWLIFCKLYSMLFSFYPIHLLNFTNFAFKPSSKLIAKKHVYSCSNTFPTLKNTYISNLYVIIYVYVNLPV